MKYRLTAVSALLLAYSVSAAATTITSDFNLNTDGWTGNQSTLAFISSGGVANTGYLEVTDAGSGNMHVIAPGKFLVDLSSGNFVLSVDLKVYATPANAQTSFGTINFVSGAGTLSTDFVATIPTSWTNYTLALSPANFGNPANFASIMSSLTSITFIVEADKNINNEKVGIDNFTLTNNLPDAPVPEPATLALLGGGLIVFAGMRRRAS